MMCILKQIYTNYGFYWRWNLQTLYPRQEKKVKKVVEWSQRPEFILIHGLELLFRTFFAELNGGHKTHLFEIYMIYKM